MGGGGPGASDVSAPKLGGGTAAPPGTAGRAETPLCPDGLHRLRRFF